MYVVTIKGIEINAIMLLSFFLRVRFRCDTNKPPEAKNQVDNPYDPSCIICLMIAMW